MENRAHAFIAGIFVLLLGAATVVVFWWFLGEREATKVYQLVSTGNVTGLNVESPVRFRGIPAGKVTSIRVDPEDMRNILVRIRIREDIPVTLGTRATLGYQGVTGLAYVLLEDHGEDPRPLVAVESHLPRLPLTPGLAEQLADAALVGLDGFKAMTEQAGAIFDEENLARFRNTLERLESAARGLDRTFDEATPALAAIREALSQENLAQFSATLSNLEQASGEAVPAVGQARQILTRLESVTSALDEVAGAAGETILTRTLPKLNVLLQELTETTAKVSRLVDEIDASPQMLITGRAQRAPGPGEPGFPDDKR